ncbi:7330_t:CDS:2, partial [Cetraspora pellucida]
VTTDKNNKTINVNFLFFCRCALKLFYKFMLSIIKMESNLNISSTIIPHIFLPQNINPQHIVDDNLIILECVLLQNYNYVIDSFKTILPLNFLDAFSDPFEAKFRINVCTINDAKVWLDKFSNLHKVTMRETQGRIIKDVKYLLSKRFYCVHSHLVKLKQGQKNKINDTNINSMEEFLDQSVGARNGKDMFDRLAKEVDEFNINEKGYAWMQPYIAPTCDNSGQPFILVIIINLMKRCHSLQQAGELVYIDTTAGLDVLNTPLMILSTSTSIRSLPLAVILTSDETAYTFSEALNALKSVMPLTAFNEHRPGVRPEVIMTDDCKAERKALHNTWNKATLLLCVFHFLQAMWRWLWDGKNSINIDDRVIIIGCLKKIVFAKTESKLEEEYRALIINQVYLKYPHFQKHFEAMWN